MQVSGIKALSCFSSAFAAFLRVSCSFFERARNKSYQKLIPFAVVLIVARTWVRRKNSKKLNADDYWIMFAAVRNSCGYFWSRLTDLRCLQFLTVPYWVCQVGSNRFGSGLHIEVVPDSDGQDFLGFERGWAAYYFITSMIKVSELLLILGISELCSLKPP